MTTPMLPGRRRALALDDAVEGRASRESQDRAVTELVRTVDAIRALPTVVPEREFVADLRVRVVAAAERELSGLPSQGGRTEAPRRAPTRALPAWRRFGLATAASVFVVVGGGAGMVSAAGQALPGDLLYPVKRGVERVDVALQDTDAERGQTLLAQADNRLGELRQLVDADSGGETGAESDQLVVGTLDTFADQADEGGDALLAAYAADGDPSSLHALDDFTVEAGRALTDLSGTLPAAADDAYSGAAGTVSDLQVDLGEVCTDCSAPAQLPTELLSAMQTLPSGPTSGDDGQTLTAGGLLDGPGNLQPPGGLPEVDPEDLDGAGGGGTLPGGGDTDGTVGSGGTDGSGDGSTDPGGIGTSGQPGTSGDDQSGTVDGTVGETVEGVVGGLLGGDSGTGSNGTGGTGDDLVDDVEDTVGGIVDGVGQVPTGTPLDGLLGESSGSGSGGAGGGGAAAATRQRTLPDPGLDDLLGDD